MSDSLIINSAASETRVALLSDNQLSEIYIERADERGVVGNIYKGRVVRVLPGMQAAFVDVGLERTGFLYVNDAVIGDGPRGQSKEGQDKEGMTEEATDVRSGGQNFRAAPKGKIEDVVKKGDTFLFQVQKEPFGTKGARITRNVSLPGRYLVYLPFAEQHGVSLRIEDEGERERLRQAIDSASEAEGAFIVRTAAEGIPTENLAKEAQLLVSLWQGVLRRSEGLKAPARVFEDLGLVLRATRDLFTGTVAEVVTDSPDELERIREFIETFSAVGPDQVKLYDGSEPIFDHFGIEVELSRALERRVWLKSGGYIIIDQAEALTAIDVNSGRFVGKSSLEETSTQINLEAVKEVAYQLRLRNIGGIIIIDFIDMSEEENRDKVLDALQEALSHDRTKTAIVRMSEIGLVEMTRKRVRESLGQMLTEDCSYCKGRGTIKSAQTVAHEIMRQVAKSLAREQPARLLVNMSEDVADYLYANENDAIEALEGRHDTAIIPVAREGFHREQYELVRVRSSGGGQ